MVVHKTEARADPLRKEFDELILKQLRDPKPKDPNGAEYASTRDYAAAMALEIDPHHTLYEVRALGGDNLKKLNAELKAKVQ